MDAYRWKCLAFCACQNKQQTLPLFDSEPWAQQVCLLFSWPCNAKPQTVAFFVNIMQGSSKNQSLSWNGGDIFVVQWCSQCKDTFINSKSRTRWGSSELAHVAMLITVWTCACRLVMGRDAPLAWEGSFSYYLKNSMQRNKLWFTTVF